MDTVAAILVKVKVGAERDVKKWLIAKMDPAKTNRHCKREPRNCLFCTNEELEKPPEEREGIRLPCENFEVKSLAYLAGPFDFALVATMPDVNIIEDFLVDCLRGWEIGGYVLDTQTLTGVTIEPNEVTASS